MARKTTVIIRVTNAAFKSRCAFTAAFGGQAFGVNGPDICCNAPAIDHATAPSGLSFMEISVFDGNIL
jgi:hypothetical protein